MSNPQPGLTPVDPVRPVAAYIGGKRVLSKRIVALIEQIPHILYAEPFVGMGGVFFRRTQRPAVEVINDISNDVVTLFRILQRLYQPFLDTIKWRLSSRAEFERLLRVDPQTLLDVERAARFLYLQRLAFGGKVDGRSFGLTRTTSARFDLNKLAPMLADVHERLASVVIERMAWAEFIARYDAPGSLFYLDPPYYGNEADYGADVFDRGDFEAMATQLRGLQGRFILSINDRPETRAAFAGFAIEEVSLNYRLSGVATPAREIIVTGP